MTVTIVPNAVANFSVSNGCDLDEVTFFNLTDTALSAFGVTVDTFYWDFESDNVIDTFTTVLGDVQHIYPSVGNTAQTITATLITITSNGCTDTISQQFVLSPSPDAAFTFSDECADSTVTFVSTSTLGTGSIVNFEWDFENDGIIDTAGVALTSIEHSYSIPGTYTVFLRVTSDSACTDTVTNIITIHPNPEASFTFDYALRVGF